MLSVLVVVALTNWLYIKTTSVEQAAVAAFCDSIFPFTLPKPVLAPTLEPTLPVTCEIPVLVIAPTEVNNTKSAALPKVGVCANPDLAKNTSSATSKSTWLFVTKVVVNFMV